MPKFLFWNLNQSERRDLVCRLARLENVDVIILAESALHNARFLEEINDAPQHYHYVSGECGHITLFARFNPSLFPAVLESHRISIRRLDLPARHKVTVVAAHLPSKMDYGEDDQVFESDGHNTASEKQIPRRVETLLGMTMLDMKLPLGNRSFSVWQESG